MGSFHLISSITRQVSTMKTILLLTIAFSSILLGEGFDLCSSDDDCPLLEGTRESFCQMECGLCSFTSGGNTFNPCHLSEAGCGSDPDCPAASGMEYVCKTGCSIYSLAGTHPWEFANCDSDSECSMDKTCQCNYCSPEDFDPCSFKPCSQDYDCAILGPDATCLEVTGVGVCIPDILDCNIPTTTPPTPAPTPMPTTPSTTTPKKKPKKCQNKRQKCKKFRRQDPRCVKKSTKRKCAKCNCRSRFCKKCK